MENNTQNTLATTENNTFTNDEKTISQREKEIGIANIQNNIIKYQKNPYQKKHSGLIIYEGGNLSAPALKLFNRLYKWAIDSGLKGNNYFIPKAEVWKYLGWTRGNYVQLKKLFDSLRKPQIERYNSGNFDPNNKEKWTRVESGGIISDYDIDRNDPMIRFSIPEVIRSIIQTPTYYARLNLETMKTMKSKYEILLYEYFRELMCRTGQNQMTTQPISIELLRKITKVEEYEYVNNNAFLKNCIQKPSEILTQNTELKIKIKNTSESIYKATSIVFELECTDLLPKIEQEDFDSQNILFLGLDKIDELKTDELKELKEYFRTPKRVSDIIKQIRKKYSIDNIDDVKKYIKAQINYMDNYKTPIENPASLLRAALFDDYAGYFIKQREEIAKKEKKEYSKIKNTSLLNINDKNTAKQELTAIKDLLPKYNFELVNEKTDFFEKLDSNTQKDLIEKTKTLYPAIANIPTSIKQHTIDSFITDDFKISPEPLPIPAAY